MSNTHKHEEDWYGNCYECGLNLLKPQANTLDEIVLGIIERAENYRQNNDMSILKSGHLTKWFIPEEVEKIQALITEARIDELEQINATSQPLLFMTDAIKTLSVYDRLETLKEKL